MKINIGTKNPVKIQAIKNVISEIKAIETPLYTPIGVESGVPDQPKGFEETLQGARNRAQRAFVDCDISIGIESGLIPVPLTNTGHMNLTACAVYDGKTFSMGLGPAFELPGDITKYVIEENLELDDAVRRAGLTDNPRIGYSEGIIGIMTNGRVTRMAYTQPAVSMALAQIFYQDTPSV